MKLADNYLSHHGILGMHWGIRRFQNKDGTLTEAGKKRYGNKESEGKDKDKEDKKSESSNGTTKTESEPVREEVKKKDYEDMSDADLQKVVNRKRLESEYDRLTTDKQNGQNNQNNQQNQKIDSLSVKDKKISEMTDAELKSVIDRLDLEKRYKDITENSKNKDQDNKKDKKNDDMNVAEIRKKKIEKMTNAELSAYIDRLNLEKRYAEVVNSTSVSTAKKAVDLVLKAGGTIATAVSTYAVIRKYLDMMRTGKFDGASIVTMPGNGGGKKK